MFKKLKEALKIHSIQRKNIILVKKYPFITPIDDLGRRLPKKNYKNYTILDTMPTGWKIAFGEQLCEDLRFELLKFGEDSLNSYQIINMNEKYGILRIYDNGKPNNSRIADVLDQYSQMSMQTCIVCGKPAKFLAPETDIPYCETCILLLHLKTSQLAALRLVGESYEEYEERLLKKD